MKRNSKPNPGKRTVTPPAIKEDGSIPPSETFTGEVRDLEFYLKEIGLWWHKSLEGILMCSRLLAEARFKLSYADWKTLKTKLPFDDTQILMFLKISESEVLNNPANAADLPGEIYRLYQFGQMDQEIFRAGREQGKIHLDSSVKDLRAFREEMGNLKRRPSRSGPSNGKSNSQSNGHDPASARPNGRSAHATSTPFRTSESMKTAEQPSPAPSLFQKEYEAFKAAQSTRAAQSTASVVDFGTEREQPAAPAPEVSREELLALIGGNCIIVPLEELDVDDLGLVQEYMETIRIMGDGVGFAKAPVLSTPKVKMPETKAPEYREPLPSSHPAALISYEYKSAEDYKLKQSDKTRLEIFSEEDQTTMVYSLTAGEVLELERLPFNEHGFRPNASGIEDRWRDISLFDAQEWLGEHPRAAESRA